MALLWMSVVFLAGAVGEPALSGKELLIELSKTGLPGGPPGIYAWSPDEGLRRVVSYARRPRWSPQHDRFLCWRGAGVAVVPAADPRSQFGTLHGDSDAVEWWPDGQWLVWRRPDVYHAADEMASVRLFRQKAKDGQLVDAPVFRAVEQEFVGRWSIDSAGGTVAYERRDMVLGLGPVGWEIRLADVGGATSRLLAPAELAGFILFNPQWQPHGKALAFDAARNGDRQRRVVVWTDGEPVRFVLDDGVSATARWDRATWTSLLGWSPDGKSLAIVTEPPFVQAIRGNPFVRANEGEVRLVSMSQGAPVRRFGGPAKKPERVVFSPEGRYLALLRSGSEPLWTESMVRLQVCAIASPRAGDPDWVFVEPPDGLQPVDIDW